MKLRYLLSSLIIVTTSHSAFAQSFDLNTSLNKVKDATKNTKVSDISSTLSTTNLISMASGQLGLSPETTQAGIGALLSAAKSYLSKDEFSTVSSALPDTNKYIDAAPKMPSNSLSSMLGKTSTKAQSAASLGYIDSAFKSIGIPKESVLPLANVLTGYMETNGYGQAAVLLKKGLSFL